MRITLPFNTTNNSLTTAAAFSMLSSSNDRGLKRYVAQISRDAGISAASIQLVGRVAPDLPWVAIGSAVTAASALVADIPPYPQIGVFMSGVTGTSGNAIIHLHEPV